MEMGQTWGKNMRAQTQARTSDSKVCKGRRAQAERMHNSLRSEPRSEPMFSSCMLSLSSVVVHLLTACNFSSDLFSVS